MEEYPKTLESKYDRRYLLVMLDHLKNISGLFTIDDLRQYGRWINVREADYSRIEKIGEFLTQIQNLSDCVVKITPMK